MPIRPRQPVPALDLPLAGGGRFNLAEHKTERFTLLSFYRGYHCQRCRANLREIESKMDRLAALGTDVIAISTDPAEKAEKTRKEWELERVKIAYDLPLDVAGKWGLFVSRGIRDNEAPIFNEPALFLVRRDGTLHFAVINSMQRMRPYPEDIIEAIARFVETDEPPRGEVEV